MSEHDEQTAGQAENQADENAEAKAEHKADETKADSKDRADDTSDGAGSSDKPEPDEEDKEEAQKMMTAYEDRPTLVMPGSGKTITGTAVNDWLDDDGNSKYANDEDSPAAKADFDPANFNSDDDDERPKNDNPKDDDSNDDRGYQSERSKSADETAEEKSIEQINKEAQDAVKENIDKDKAFNEEVLKQAKEKEKDTAGASS